MPAVRLRPSMPIGSPEQDSAHSRASGPSRACGRERVWLWDVRPDQQSQGRSIFAIDSAPIAHINNVDEENLIIDAQNNSVISNTI